MPKLKRTFLNKPGAWLSVLLIGLILTIFFFSSQSSKTSMAISNQVLDFYNTLDQEVSFSKVPITQWLKRVFIEVVLQGKYQAPEALIRKLAHFTLYTLLGLLTTSYFINRLRRYPHFLWLSGLLGTSIPALIAILDETWQLRAQRTASIQDVYLDALGGITGASIALIAYGLFVLIMYLLTRMTK